jgi:hypothetical protein
MVALPVGHLGELCCRELDDATKEPLLMRDGVLSVGKPRRSYSVTLACELDARRRRLAEARGAANLATLVLCLVITAKLYQLRTVFASYWKVDVPQTIHAGTLFSFIG